MSETEPPTHEGMPEIDITSDILSFSAEISGDEENSKRFIFEFKLENGTNYIVECERIKQEGDLIYLAGKLVSGTNDYPIKEYITFAHIVVKQKKDLINIARLVIQPHRLM